MTGSLTATLWKSWVPCKPRCVRLAYLMRRSASSTLRPLQAITTTSCRPRCGGYTFRDQSAPNDRQMPQQWPPQQPWQPQQVVVQHKTAGAAKGCLMRRGRARTPPVPEIFSPLVLATTVLTVLIVLGAFSGCSEQDAPTPTPIMVTVTATPSPTPSSTAQPTASPKRRAQSPARFDHFVVTVDDLRRASPSEVRLLAKVCVRSLPPDPQGDRTRISWDPWSVRARSRMIDAGPAHATFKGAFPPDATYRVGQCASGWIPFFTRGTLTTIKYSNGVGDVAIWDADRLDRKPEIRAKSSPTPQRSTAPTRRLVTPGAFCTPEGATSRTSTGTPMVCKSKDGDQPRWRR